MNEHTPNPEDLALWNRCKKPLSRELPIEDLMDLAAFLDGMLDEAGRARVESAMAENPSVLSAVCDVRETLADRSGERSPAVAGRIGTDPDGEGGRWTITTCVRWGSAVAALIAVAFVGYYSGALSASEAQVAISAELSPDVARAMSFGVFDDEQSTDAWGFGLVSYSLGESSE